MPGNPRLSRFIMKRLLVLCVTSTLALPTQSISTGDTPTIRPGSNTEGTIPDERSLAESKPLADEVYLYGRKYGTLLGDSSKSKEQEQHQVPESIQSELDLEPDTSLDRLHEAFPDGMNRPIAPEKYSNAPAKPLKERPCNHLQYIMAYLKEMALVDFIENHGTECVALAIFLLFPLAYVVLELIERVLRYCTREEFPWRGRDRVRLIGPERQFRAWSNQRRERFLDEKSFNTQN